MFEKILEYFGGVAGLARSLGVSQPAVSQWRHNGISKRCAIEIEILSGGKFKAVDIAGQGVSNDD